MYMIAEIAQAHDGSLGILHSYIDALATTGIDAIKFQTHIAEAESSAHEPFRVNFSYVDKTRYDYWKRMGFSLAQWQEIKAHCDDVGVEFIASPFSNAAVDLLEELEVQRYKIGSGEVSNLLLLEKISRTGKPVILSSGMSSFAELEVSIDYLRQRKIKTSILQCTTAYPTAPKEWGLDVMEQLKQRFSLETGFSDHSGNVVACLAAAARGAEILEFHAAFDKRMFGPDASASLTIDEITFIVKGVRDICESLAVKIDKGDNAKFDVLKGIFEKSLAVNKALKAGSVIRFEDLEAKKPKGQGIDAAHYESLIGKKINKNMKKWDFLTGKDINE